MLDKCKTQQVRKELGRTVEVVRQDSTRLYTVEKGTTLPLKVSVLIAITPERGADAFILIEGMFYCYVLESAYKLRTYPLEKTYLCFRIDENGEIEEESIEFQIGEFLVTPTISKNPETYPPARKLLQEQREREHKIEEELRKKAVQERIAELPDNYHLYSTFFSGKVIAEDGFQKGDILNTGVSARVYMVENDIGRLNNLDSEIIESEYKKVEDIIIFDKAIVVNESKDIYLWILQMLELLFAEKVSFGFMREKTRQLYEMYRQRDDEIMERVCTGVINTCLEWECAERSGTNRIDESKVVKQRYIHRSIQMNENNEWDDTRWLQMVHQYEVIHSFQPVYEQANVYAKYYIYDPVEKTELFREARPEVEETVKKILENEVRGMGFCHMWWYREKSVLDELFGIEWLSPAEIAPWISYD